VREAQSISNLKLFNQSISDPNSAYKSYLKKTYVFEHAEPHKCFAAA
jgi:hypothetical protein